MNTIVIVVMGMVLLSVLPLWPYSANWGYLPSGGLGFLLLALVLLTDSVAVCSADATGVPISSRTMLAVTPQIIPRPVSELMNPLLEALLDIWFMGSLPTVIDDAVTHVLVSCDSEFWLHVFQ